MTGIYATVCSHVQHVHRGFKHEGTKRRANWAEGHWEDLLYMGILEDEWAEIHKKTQGLA